MKCYRVEARSLSKRERGETSGEFSFSPDYASDIVTTCIFAILVKT